MNWQKALLAGLAGGVALSISDFIFHGLVMADTYVKYSEVFSQEPANPLFFVLVAIFIGLGAGILFGKTRRCWADSFQGGATYGFFLGLISFWPSFYSALVIDGWPYYLSWCHGGINLIGSVIGGAVLGAVYRRA